MFRCKIKNTYTEKLWNSPKLLAIEFRLCCLLELLSKFFLPEANIILRTMIQQALKVKTNIYVVLVFTPIYQHVRCHIKQYFQPLKSRKYQNTY